MLGIEGFSIQDERGESAARFAEGVDIVGLDYNRGDRPEIGTIISAAVELDEIESIPEELGTHTNDIA